MFKWTEAIPGLPPLSGSPEALWQGKAAHIDLGEARYWASEGTESQASCRKGKEVEETVSSGFINRTTFTWYGYQRKGFLGMNRIRCIQPCCRDYSVNWQSMARGGREDCFKIGGGGWGW